MQGTVPTSLIKTGLLMAAMTALFVTLGYLIAGPLGVVVSLAVAAGINAYAFWNSDELALKWHGARVVTAASAPALHRMVAELSQNAGLPMPGVYVIDSDQPNAFATGRSPEKSAVAVTTGLMRILSEQELAGVVAHELAHIQNRDTLIMTISATVAGAISFLAQYAIFFRGRNGAAGLIATLVAMFLAPIAATLIQMLISRTREYAADKAGGEICGNPIWLAGALKKISSTAPSIPMQSAEEHPASAHLFIYNPLTGGGIDNLFSTHPKAENRIARLVEQAEEMRRFNQLSGNSTWDLPKSRVQR